MSNLLYAVWCVVLILLALHLWQKPCCTYEGISPLQTQTTSDTQHDIHDWESPATSNLVMRISKPQTPIDMSIYGVGYQYLY